MNLRTDVKQLTEGQPILLRNFVDSFPVHSVKALCRSVNFFYCCGKIRININSAVCYAMNRWKHCQRRDSSTGRAKNNDRARRYRLRMARMRYHPTADRPQQFKRSDVQQFRRNGDHEDMLNTASAELNPENNSVASSRLHRHLHSGKVNAGELKKLLQQAPETGSKSAASYSAIKLSSEEFPALNSSREHLKSEQYTCRKSEQRSSTKNSRAVVSDHPARQVASSKLNEIAVVRHNIFEFDEVSRIPEVRGSSAVLVEHLRLRGNVRAVVPEHPARQLASSTINEPAIVRHNISGFSEVSRIPEVRDSSTALIDDLRLPGNVHAVVPERPTRQVVSSTTNERAVVQQNSGFAEVNRISGIPEVRGSSALLVEDARLAKNVHAVVSDHPARQVASSTLNDRAAVQQNSGFAEVSRISSIPEVCHSSALLIEDARLPRNVRSVKREQVLHRTEVAGAVDSQRFTWVENLRKLAEEASRQEVISQEVQKILKLDEASSSPSAFPLVPSGHIKESGQLSPVGDAPQSARQHGPSVAESASSTSAGINSAGSPLHNYSLSECLEGARLSEVIRGILKENPLLRPPIQRGCSKTCGSVKNALAGKDNACAAVPEHPSPGAAEGIGGTHSEIHLCECKTTSSSSQDRPVSRIVRDPFAGYNKSIQDIPCGVPVEYRLSMLISCRKMCQMSGEGRETVRFPPLQPHRLGDEVLFYMFYNLCGEIHQFTAANVLYSRGWRYHKKHQIWMTRFPSDVMEQSAHHERAVYTFFSTLLWAKVTKEMTVFFEDLECQPIVPDVEDASF
ncbi:hypothetical protein QR680_011023 [Steinernema hermaphroditum]|uniref:NOT2/NOT3/NOT5 C-terminal domain-containing protein n=1 Tax=Steinernema hermaphroditum TaxID=289476 RepID=A0AA39IQW4_9BILA|nr:hypothetical protein QR680_011023 [Steinernema hermaphroditum]